MNRKVLAGIAFATIIASGCATQPSRRVVDGYIAEPAQMGFTVNQGGKQIPAVPVGKHLVFNLKNQDFTFTTSHPEIRLYLAEQDVGEFRKTSKGDQINHLAGPLSGASSPDSTMLFIADPQDEYSPNNALNVDHGMKAVTPGVYRFDVKSMLNMKNRNEINMVDFSGELFGFAWVDFNKNEVMDIDEISRIKLVIGK